jgi:glutathione peroxidase
LWNFEKFLIGKTGEIVARFAPDVAPNDARLTAKINEELAK